MTTPAPALREVDHALSVPEDAYRRGARKLVDVCARLRAGERAYVLADDSTQGVAEHVAVACRECAAVVRVDVIRGPAIHGGSPPPQVGEGMCWADVVFCLTRMSLAHTAERHRACQGGTRFLSLPDYSLALLGGRSLQYNFAAVVPLARDLARRLDGAHQVRLRTERGTDLTCSAAGRRANCCPGVCWEPGTLGSPPDAEVNIAPLEGAAEGIVVVDGSIPCREIGRLAEPVVLEVRQGAIVRVSGAAGPARALETLFARVGDPAARLLAEVGIGLNDHAEITGCMLEDEGCAGTVHLGFGSNATIGGTNRVPFHLDFVLRAPTLEVDGVCLVCDGALTTAKIAA